MSNEHSPNRKFWWIIAALAALIVAGWIALTSGVLAMWLDPEPEAGMRVLLGIISPTRIVP